MLPAPDSSTGSSSENKGNVRVGALGLALRYEKSSFRSQWQRL